MTAGQMTAGEQAVRDFLHDNLPDYAQEHLAPRVAWEWLAWCPKFSDGEGAVVTLAAHLWPAAFVVAEDPRTLVALLGAVDHPTRVAWALALRKVGDGMLR